METDISCVVSMSGPKRTLIARAAWMPEQASDGLADLQASLVPDILAPVKREAFTPDSSSDSDIEIFSGRQRVNTKVTQTGLGSSGIGSSNQKPIDLCGTPPPQMQSDDVSFQAKEATRSDRF